MTLAHQTGTAEAGREPDREARTVLPGIPLGFLRVPGLFPEETMSRLSRRAFVADSIKAGALAGLGDFAFLRGLPRVGADDTRLPRERVRFSPDIEPLVRLIEDTTREALFDAVASRMRQGVGYQELLTALFLAGVRGIQPRPVGFKFHAVLVINSAHLASQAMPDRERWLPLFWALDAFKSSQARNHAEGDWAMAPPPQSKPLPVHRARENFHAALDNWDEEAADRAVVALVRGAGASEVIESFWRYGARDFRDIGHKAIYTANSWRTLQAIGWRHAEPVMRSLAYAVLEHDGDNPAHRDVEADRPGRENLRRAAEFRADWPLGKVEPHASTDVLAALRTTNVADACAKLVEVVNRGASPACVWDALFLRAGELLMQQPGIIAIHCVTSTNALHFGYQASADDTTRRFLMLQCAAFLAMFGQRMAKGRLRDDLQVDRLEKVEPQAKGAEAIAEVLADISKDRVLAARKTLALAERDPAGVDPLMTAARRLIFNKGRDAHDYKFSSAALEDYYHATPAARARCLATAMFNLHGTGDRDNALIDRARASLGGFGAGV
jgi:hypothetical protein